MAVKNLQVAAAARARRVDLFHGKTASAASTARFAPRLQDLERGVCELSSLGTEWETEAHRVREYTRERADLDHDAPHAAPRGALAACGDHLLRERELMHGQSSRAIL